MRPTTCSRRSPQISAGRDPKRRLFTFAFSETMRARPHQAPRRSQVVQNQRILVQTRPPRPGGVVNKTQPKAPLPQEGFADQRGGIQRAQGEGVQCDETEADSEQPIAAPAWPFCATRPPLRNRCVLRTARAAGSGFRGRHRALCAGRCILGRLFGLREAARPRN